LEIDTDALRIKADGVDTVHIADEAVTEDKLDIDNAPVDGYYLTWNQTAGKFEWKDVDTDAVQDDDYIANEIPSGAIDSINDTFTLANTPIVGSVSVFLNGLHQAPGSGLDYTISGSTITFSKAPRTNSDLYVTYIRA
ncbi:MAG: hypothetical protein R3321_07210, partial [Nitrososphaeraceae archaeon]|nr:hypothetical protein [Nitrososphaeraceae archaeon]